MLLESEGHRWLLDCGATSLVALRGAGIDPSSIDAVFLSHLHGDHFGGVPFLVLDGQFRRFRAAAEGSARVEPLGMEPDATGGRQIQFDRLYGHLFLALGRATRSRVVRPTAGDDVIKA